MRYWLTNEETLELQQANAPYYKVLSLDEMISNSIGKPESVENIEPISIKEVYGLIQKTFPEVRVNCRNMAILGKHLKTLGFDTRHTRLGTVYYVVPIQAA